MLAFADSAASGDSSGKRQLKVESSAVRGGAALEETLGIGLGLGLGLGTFLSDDGVRIRVRIRVRFRVRVREGLHAYGPMDPWTHGPMPIAHAGAQGEGG